MKRGCVPEHGADSGVWFRQLSSAGRVAVAGEGKRLAALQPAVAGIAAPPSVTGLHESVGAPQPPAVMEYSGVQQSTASSGTGPCRGRAPA